MMINRFYFLLIPGYKGEKKLRLITLRVHRTPLRISFQLRLVVTFRSVSTKLFSITLSHTLPNFYTHTLVADGAKFVRIFFTLCLTFEPFVTFSGFRTAEHVGFCILFLFVFR